MARRCILHIGMNKAGSTTIQKCFSKYDDAETFFLPLGAPNHSKLVSYAFLNNVSEKYFETIDPAARQEFCAQQRAEMTTQIAGDSRNVIISAEILSVFPKESVDAIVAFLRSHFDEIKAIAYIREPANFMASQFQQSLRDNASDVDLDRLYPNYRTRFRRWYNQLGADISFVTLNPDMLIEGNLVIDFATRMGLQKPSMDKLGTVANSTLSAEAIAVLFAHRHAHDWVRTSAGRQRSVNRALLARLQTFGHRKFAFSDVFIGPFLETKSSDIAWMENRMQGSLTGQSSKETEVSFGSSKDITDFANACQPTFLQWFETSFPQADVPQGGVVDILDAAYARLQADMPATFPTIAAFTPSLTGAR